MGTALRLRLRNPPPVFLGREDECESVVEALDRAPVTLVCGSGGLGKTSLVSAALHRRTPPCVDRTLAFSATPGDRTGEQLAKEIMTALSSEMGAKGGGEGMADTATFVASCVDLADALGAVIVLDDLHFVGGPIVRELLSSAAAYARKSKWIATSRAPLDIAGIEGQTVNVGGLSEDTLMALANAWSKNIPTADAARAVRDANGSPFWLRIRLGQKNAPSSDVGDALLAGLSKRAETWVRALAWLEVPLPESAIAVFGVAPEAAELKALELRGLVERVPEGLRIHAVARSILVESASEEHESIATKLAEYTEPSLVIESVRLDIAARRLARAFQTVDARFAELVTAGQAPRLWQILDGLDDPRLLAAKLACAVDFGGGLPFEWALEQAEPADPETRLVWLRALTLSSRKGEAVERARALAHEVEKAAPAISAQAWLLAARVSVMLTRSDDALDAAARARALAPTDVDVCARADAWMASAYVIVDRCREALELCASLQSRLSPLAPATRRDVDELRGTVLVNLGRMRRAYEVFVRAKDDGLVSVAQRSVRVRLVRSSLFAVELGRFEEARRLLDDLGGVAHRSEELFVFHSMNEFRYWAAIGDIAAAERHLAALERGVTTSKSGYWSSWVASPSHYLGVVAARPFDEELAARSADFPLTRALGAWHEVRATGRTTRLDAEKDTEVLDSAIVRLLARSNAALVHGDAGRAAAHATTALGLAEEEGLILWQADGLLTMAEALAASGSAQLGGAASELGRIAVQIGARRYLNEAAFFKELARGTEADPARLDRLAAEQPGTHAARRSRALLGGDADLDLVDMKVVARARSSSVKPVRVTAGASARPGLGLDSRTSRVWLPDGTQLDLSRKPVAMKILLALLDGSGRATKEQLVAKVWSIDDYHPLRDDKRLHVAIGRLRALLGDESLVETTADGYRIAPDIPAYRVLPDVTQPS